MPILHRISGVIRSVAGRGPVQRELNEEVDSYFQMLVEEKVDRGLGLDEARRRTHLEMGGVEQVKESVRAARPCALLDILLQDVRYAARLLRKSPGFSAAAILTLALGIGANTAIFTILNSFLLRPLPVHEPSRLVGVQQSRDGQTIPFVDVWTWEQIRNRPHLFERVCAWVPMVFNTSDRGQANIVMGLLASGEVFETLGVPAVLGRTFTKADDRKGGGAAGPAAVISFGYWQREFGGSADVIGRPLTLDRSNYTIVGVTPREFFGPMPGRSFDVAVPLGVAGRPHGWLYVTGRLRPDQTPESATALLRAVHPQIRDAVLREAATAGDDVSLYLRQPLSVTPAATGQSPLRERFEIPLIAMLSLGGVVMLVACVNVANLMLARCSARSHEMNVRRALGASRSRLACQVLVESLLLSAIGASVGLVFAAHFSEALVRQVSSVSRPLFLDLSLDWGVLSFTAAVTVGTALLFGLVPALRAAQVQPQAALREGGRSQAGGRRSGMNQILIVAQVALSLILVVAAGLFVRTFATMATMNLGFDRDRTVILSLNTEDAKVPPAARLPLYERVRQMVAAVPGVADAVTLMTVPVSSDHWLADVRVSGQPSLALVSTGGPFLNAVSPGYFAVFGAPVVFGRGFTSDDRTGAPLVAVVNQTFVRRFLGGGSPLGESLRFAQNENRAANKRPESPPFQIVGVASDSGSATYFGLREEIPATVYLCIGQMSPDIADFSPPASFRIAVSVEARSTARINRDVVAAVSRAAPDLRVRVRTMASYIDDTMVTERLTAMLSGMFGVLALLLAAVGVYGVVAYTVSQRRREIGIRLALGASAADVVGMVLSRVALAVAAGIAIGAVISFWLSRIVATLLFGLKPRDPATFASAAIVLMAVAALAAWLPAGRASRIDPATALHAE